MYGDVRHLSRRSRLLGVLALVLLVLALAPSAHAAEAFGGIEGKVTDASSHDPLQGIEVCAITANFELLGEEESEWEHAEGCAKTGSGGEYAISGLRPEKYFVAFFVLPESKLDYMSELYNDAFELSAATQVTVVAEKDTPSIDGELSLGAEIAGKVTDAATGAPIGGAIACALRADAKGSLEGVSCAVSEGSGEYTLRGLPSGSYKLGFIAKGFEVGYFNGKSSQAEAETVSVLAPQLTPGINDALTPTPSGAGPGSTPPGELAPSSKLPGPLSTGSPAPSDATLSLLGKRLTVAGSGDALVKVKCTGSETCRAKLTLRTKRTVTVKGKRQSHTVAIGTSAVLSVAAGETETVHIKLDPVERRLLRDHRQLRVELTLVTPGRTRIESVLLVDHVGVK